MAVLQNARNAVYWFFDDLGARVVAETGIPSHRHHLGKLILRSLKDAPDFIMQIDAVTGESETYNSVLGRSVRCATAFNNLGLGEGDNIALMAPNHLHLAIPYYAAIYLGIGIAPLDIYLTVAETEAMLKINNAKVVFCQSKKVSTVKEALRNLQRNTTVVTFDDGKDCLTFSYFLEKYGVDADVENFRATELDPKENVVLLLPTSGTTGFPKSASLTHKNLALSLTHAWVGFTNFPTPTRLAMIASPLQWLTAVAHFTFSTILRYTRLQSSAEITSNIFVELVNKYRPSLTLVSTPLITTLTKPENLAGCDITCFESILIGGSAVSQELLLRIHEISPNTHVQVSYGMTEVGGFCLYEDKPSAGSVGKPTGLFDYRLVNPDTKEDITEPHVNGELWLRGPTICKGYYKNPDATNEAFEDGWFKTGDILYRDDHYSFYFVDRMKLLMKYRNHQISPLELEKVINKHPGVFDVAVTSILHAEHGDLPVACVIRKPGHTVTAQEIKDLVKNSLADSKLLRGGVIFMKDFPMTATTKLNRQQLKKMVAIMDKE